MHALTWKTAWASPVIRKGLLLLLLAAVTLLSILPWFFHDILEPKAGLLVHDPLFDYFVPRDYSILIFAIIWASIGLTIYRSWDQPVLLVQGLTTYLVANYLRLLALYLVTLAPPGDMIVLADPVIDQLAYGRQPVVKDLFYSGHLTTLTLLVLLETNRTLKLVRSAGALAVSLMLIAQRVHYTVDIVGAVLVTAALHGLISRAWCKVLKGL